MLAGREGLFGSAGSVASRGEEHWDFQRQVYLRRAEPSPESIHKLSGYEFFAGNDEQGQPQWSKPLSDIKPLIETMHPPGVSWCLLRISTLVDIGDLDQDAVNRGRVVPQRESELSSEVPHVFAPRQIH